MLKNVDNPPPIAFTYIYNGKARDLRTKIGISEYKKDTIKRQPAFNGIAIWDTGATASVITAKVASELGLIPIGKTNVRGANITKISNVYLVNIYLPNRVQVVGVRVTEIDEITGNFDVLIGMDIITLGDFAVTSKSNITKISYQMPSTHDIDFVIENKRIAKDTRIMAKLKKDRAEYNKAKQKTKKKRKRR